MPSVRMIENVPCASPKCTSNGTVWCDDARLIPFAEDKRAGAWFCGSCAWKPKCGVDDAAFIVPATFARDALVEIEAMENAVDHQE